MSTQTIRLDYLTQRAIMDLEYERRISVKRAGSIMNAGDASTARAYWRRIEYIDAALRSLRRIA